MCRVGVLGLGSGVHSAGAALGQWGTAQAELAHQRGEHFAAYATMLSIARSSGDPRLARRALEFALSGQLPGEALRAGQLWHELAPKSEEAAQALLGLQLANGRYDEAKQALAQQLAAATPLTLPIAIAGVQRQLARVQDPEAMVGLVDRLRAELQAQGVRPRVWFGERWITSVFDLFAYMTEQGAAHAAQGCEAVSSRASHPRTQALQRTSTCSSKARELHAGSGCPRAPCS